MKLTFYLLPPYSLPMICSSSPDDHLSCVPLKVLSGELVVINNLAANLIKYALIGYLVGYVHLEHCVKCWQYIQRVNIIYNHLIEFIVKQGKIHRNS